MISIQDLAPVDVAASQSSATSSHSTALFSTSACSTSESSAHVAIDAERQPGTSADEPAAIKASLIHLPLHLPEPPEPFPEVSERLVLDDDLNNAPTGFVVHKLRSLGSSLLKSTSTTCLYIPPGPALPDYLRCTIAPPSSPLVDDASIFRPSHVLAIRSSDSTRTLLLPVHGLLFAAVSPPLSILSSRPEKQPRHPSLPTSPRPAPRSDRDVHLPVVELNLPSSKAFPLLQGWIYLRAPEILLSSLLPDVASPPPPPPPPPPATTTRQSTPPGPASLSHLLNPIDDELDTPTRTTPLDPDDRRPRRRPTAPEHLAHLVSTVPSRVLLDHIHLVHSLWGDVVALQVGDDELWQCLALAWKILVAAVALRERARHAARDD
ncbi:hypothetical protein JCM10212_000750 [Sporobolomyces blumeae]